MGAAELEPAIRGLLRRYQVPVAPGSKDLKLDQKMIHDQGLKQRETQALWRELVRVARVAPGRDAELADLMTRYEGCDALSVLMLAHASGPRLAAEHCLQALSRGVLFLQGKTAAPVPTGSRALREAWTHAERIYTELVSAFRAATATPPYTLEKTRRVEELCAQLRRWVDDAGHRFPRPEAQALHRFAVAAEQWRAIARGELHWMSTGAELDVRLEIEELLTDAAVKAAMFDLPPRAWYDLACLSLQAKKMIRRLKPSYLVLNEWSWLNNMRAKVLGDETQHCINRARIFSRDEARFDPFTNQPTTRLPHGDSSRSNSIVDRPDWKLNENTQNRTNLLRYDLSHTVPQFTWTGATLSGGRKTYTFVVDTWDTSGKYRLCMYDTWMQRFGAQAPKK